MKIYGLIIHPISGVGLKTKKGLYANRLVPRLNLNLLALQYSLVLIQPGQSNCFFINHQLILFYFILRDKSNYLRSTNTEMILK